jgi:hypothetical protein
VPLVQTQARGEPNVVLVRVLAKGREDDAWIQLRCVQGDDRLWRVSLINFHAPKAGDSDRSRDPNPSAAEPASVPAGPTTAPAGSQPGR